MRDGIARAPQADPAAFVEGAVSRPEHPDAAEIDADVLVLLHDAERVPRGRVELEVVLAVDAGAVAGRHAIERDVLAIEIQPRQIVVVRILHPPDDPARALAARRAGAAPTATDPAARWCVERARARSRHGRHRRDGQGSRWSCSRSTIQRGVVRSPCDVEGETGRRPSHGLGVERARAVRHAGRRRGRGERQGSETRESRVADRHGRSRIVARRVGLHQFFTLLLPE